jgi:hypothetical protein
MRAAAAATAPPPPGEDEEEEEAEECIDWRARRREGFIFLIGVGGVSGGASGS